MIDFATVARKCKLPRPSELTQFPGATGGRMSVCGRAGRKMAVRQILATLRKKAKILFSFNEALAMLEHEM
jgi:hypothetical protein